MGKCIKGALCTGVVAIIWGIFYGGVLPALIECGVVLLCAVFIDYITL